MTLKKGEGYKMLIFPRFLFDVVSFYFFLVLSCETSVFLQNLLQEIYLFSQQVYIEYLLWVSEHSRCLGYVNSD